MDEDKLNPEDKIQVRITPEGAAGLWLKQNLPDHASRAHQVSLGKVIQAVYDAGVLASLHSVKKCISECPTVSAVEATLDSLEMEMQAAIRDNTKLESTETEHP